MTLTSHRTSDELHIVQDYNIPAKMTKSASLDKHIWKLYDHVNIKIHTIKNDIPQGSEYYSDSFDSVCSNSAITMQCRVSRKPGYFVINCLLPTLMITLCVFFTFMMDYGRYQYRFSLLFTTMLTSITFRWAIHGRVLPTISYLTFLDVYCVSSILIVFSAMIWHAIYLVIYKEDQELAEVCDRYAMIAFAVVVFLEHVGQTAWFLVAFQKKLHLEKLDRLAALNYIKHRMTMSKQTHKLNTNNESEEPKEQMFSNLHSKRVMYSFNKLDDFSVITVTSNECNRVKNVLADETLMEVKKECEKDTDNNNNSMLMNASRTNNTSFKSSRKSLNKKSYNDSVDQLLPNRNYLPLLHQSSRDS